MRFSLYNADDAANRIWEAVFWVGEELSCLPILYKVDWQKKKRKKWNGPGAAFSPRTHENNKLNVSILLFF